MSNGLGGRGREGKGRKIPWYVPEFRELVLVLVRAGTVEAGDGERWREPKRPCFFSGMGAGAGSSMTSSSGFRLEKKGIVGSI